MSQGEREHSSMRVASNLPGCLTSRRSGSRFAVVLTAGILLTGISVAYRTAMENSITFDEAGHVVAGLAYWQERAWHVYPHNPPLIKLCLALPAYAQGVRLDPEWIIDGSTNSRIEGAVVQHTAAAFAPQRLYAMYRSARCVSIVFYAASALLLVGLAAKLVGIESAPWCCAIWCMNPWCIAYASLATPDMGAAFFALLAFAVFLYALASPKAIVAAAAGVCLGLAQLSKFSLVFLYPACFIVTLVEAKGRAFRPSPKPSTAVASLLIAVSISILVIWCGYPPATSQGLNEASSVARLIEPRFGVETGVPEFAAPLARWVLPDAYVDGLVQQWNDVQAGWPNYLGGVVDRTGWVAYYPLALLTKLPIGFLALVALWLSTRLANGLAQTKVTALQCYPSKVLLYLVAPPAMLSLLLLSNLSLTYSRYLLPAAPFLALIVACELFHRPGLLRRVACGLTILAAAETLAVHPHYLGYFNFAASGICDTTTLFVDAEIDWGQDVLRFDEWYRACGDETPLQTALYSPFLWPYPGISPALAEHGSGWCYTGSRGTLRVPEEPHLGRLAISITLRNRFAATFARDEQYFRLGTPKQVEFCRWLMDRQPWTTIGTSILVYRFDRQDIREWSQRTKPEARATPS